LFLVWAAWSKKFLKQKIEARTEELKKAREEAEKANKAKDQLLANVSHEIRTLMNSIVGFTTQTLKTDLTKNQKEYLEMVDISAHDLTRIINDMLNFSKIESGELNIGHSEFQLENVLKDVINNLKEQAKQKGIKLILEKKNDIPGTLMGDDLRLKQVLNNLISNAVKFTREGSVIIKVSCTKKNKTSARILFSVEDTGCGISSEHIKKIFLPYEQLTCEDGIKSKGIGLGLTISKQLVDFMKGEINVESVLGKGSVFSFEIPFSIPEKKKEAVEEILEDEEKKHDFADLKGIHVLVVEDDKASRILMLNVLSNAGMKVDFAENGNEAIQKINSISYDVVLMDMLLPGIDGFETIKKIRQDQRFTELPIISVTAYAVVGEDKRCLDVGANAYVSKPIDSDNLLLTIKKWIKKE
jgi:hypothetical protein